MHARLVVVCALLLFISACAEQPNRPEALVPVEERHVPANADDAQQTEANVYDAQDTVAPTVIAALISDAERHAQSGKTDKAVASLERAIRIEPNNPLLWHRFAEIRLQEKNWQQAIALARRSNALSVDNAALTAANWGVIARAYEGMGNLEKAKEARKKQRLTG